MENGKIITFIIQMEFSHRVKLLNILLINCVNHQNKKIEIPQINNKHLYMLFIVEYVAFELFNQCTSKIS